MTSDIGKQMNTYVCYISSGKDHGVMMQLSRMLKMIPTLIRIKYDRLTIMGSTSIWRRGISWILLLKEHHFCFRQALLRKLPCSSSPAQRASRLTPHSAGSAFASKHAEAIFVTGHDPSVLAPKIANIRKLAKEEGRDPASIKSFCTLTPIIGRTDEEAQEKLAEVKKYASTIGGLVLFSGWTGIDISKIPLGKEITKDDSLEAHKVTSALNAFTTTSKNIPKWTPEVVAEVASIGGMGPVSVGSPSTVADELERWVVEADVDGFNLGYVTTPGTFEDVVDLLVPELRRRGIYPQEVPEGLTAREKVYGAGQAHLRDDHLGSTYKYDVHKEEAPYALETKAEEQTNGRTSKRRRL
jgi:hypothetical protein